MTRVVVSTSAAARHRAASAFLSDIPSGSPVLVVGASRGAADDLVRAVARASGATFGFFRFGLTELAARAAALATQALRIPATMASVEAMAARAVFDARQTEELAYFGPVASTPGFPRALSRTLHELRLAGVGAAGLASLGPAAGDIGRLLARVEAQLADAGADDRASLFAAAAAAWRENGGDGGARTHLPWAGVLHEDVSHYAAEGPQTIAPTLYKDNIVRSPTRSGVELPVLLGGGLSKADGSPRLIVAAAVLDL